VTGSIAFGALARVVLATAKIVDENGKATRLFVRAKSNNGPDGGGFNYHIERVELRDYKGVHTSRIIWGETVEGAARELLMDSSDKGPPENNSALEEAKRFLLSLLANGPILTQEILKDAKNAGFSATTIRRAGKAIGIESFHEGFGQGSAWKWFIPSKVIIESKDDHTQVMSTFRKNDHLWEKLQKHPPIVEGCLLSDILSQAAPVDYDALLDFEVLGCFARTLRDKGIIRAIERRNE
jgi:putative DNA primase/helicase